MPLRYTCDGWNMSPPLMWTHLPDETKSLALIIEDPDAPQKSWTHWVVYNISPSVHSLAEGIPAKDLPHGCLQGKNDWGKIGYGGPCPPSGMHRYFHHLYALNCVLPDLNNPNKAILENEMRGHVIAKTVLTGLYQRPRA